MGQLTVIVETLRKLIGIHDSAAISTLSSRELGDLLYRDNLMLKHHSGSTIAQALAKQAALPAATAAKDHISHVKPGLTKALVDHLIAETRLAWVGLQTCNPVSDPKLVLNSITVSVYGLLLKL